MRIKCLCIKVCCFEKTETKRDKMLMEIEKPKLEEQNKKPKLEDQDKKLKEEKAIILDFLPYGYHVKGKSGKIRTPIAQAMGKEHFVLLEIVPKKDAKLQVNEEVYIGEGKREKIHHINGKLSPKKLTSTAKLEIQFAVSELIKKDEKKFIDFFNNAQPLSMRMHSIELIPGMGKKRMWEILQEREIEPFKNFEDFKKRLKTASDPEKSNSKKDNR